MFHPDIDKLLVLRQSATPGVWGPTTAPPSGDPAKGEPYKLKEGERGKPTWGAVVSDHDGRPGKDHERYYHGKETWYFEEGADIYGGTLIAESVRGGNGEYIAALHNNLPGLTQTIRNLRGILLELGLHPVILDRLISESMKGDDE